MTSLGFAAGLIGLTIQTSVALGLLLVVGLADLALDKLEKVAS
jgi:hypothetical protein